MSSRPPASDEAARSPRDRGENGLCPWVPPRIEELPPLTDLTLQTGSPIDGGGDTGGGGSVVF